MDYTCNIHIGAMAPDFSANTTFGRLSITDFKGKWLVFFSHPGDFTPVCTTEFLAFASRYKDFKNLDAELLGLSIDSNASHLAWVDNIYKNSNVQIPFPIIADTTGDVAKLYNMACTKDTALVRSVYIIDPLGIIRVILTYPKEIGRNINEILRILQALQESDNNKVLMPANWEIGSHVAIVPPTTYEDLKELKLNSNDYAYFDWYLCFKKIVLGGEQVE